MSWSSSAALATAGFGSTDAPPKATETSAVAPTWPPCFRAPVRPVARAVWPSFPYTEFILPVHQTSRPTSNSPMTALKVHFRFISYYWRNLNLKQIMRVHSPGENVFLRETTQCWIFYKYKSHKSVRRFVLLSYTVSEILQVFCASDPTPTPPYFWPDRSCWGRCEQSLNVS